MLVQTLGSCSVHSSVAEPAPNPWREQDLRVRQQLLWESISAQMLKALITGYIQQECPLGQQKDKGERGNKNERDEHQAGTDSSGMSHQAGWGS